MGCDSEQKEKKADIIEKDQELDEINRLESELNKLVDF